MRALVRARGHRVVPVPRVRGLQPADPQAVPGPQRHGAVGALLGHQRPGAEGALLGHPQAVEPADRGRPRQDVRRVDPRLEPRVGRVVRSRKGPAVLQRAADGLLADRREGAPAQAVPVRVAVAVEAGVAATVVVEVEAEEAAAAARDAVQVGADDKRSQKEDSTL